MAKNQKTINDEIELSLYLYKNSDPTFANDTIVFFLDNGDIRIDGSEYGTLINEYQGHDDDYAFSIHKEDFGKIINEIKRRRPKLKTHDEKCKKIEKDVRERISNEQKEIYVYLEAAFSKDCAYRSISELCMEIGVERYDIDIYI